MATKKSLGTQHKSQQKRRKVYAFAGSISIFSMLILLAFGLFVERLGIRNSVKQEQYYLDQNLVLTKSESLEGLTTHNLAIFDSSNPTSAAALANFQQVFEDIKVKTEYVDLGNFNSSQLSAYDTVVVLMPNAGSLGTGLTDLLNWAENGGNLLFAMSLLQDETVASVSNRLGVASSNPALKKVEGLTITEGFMLGAQSKYIIDDSFESAWDVTLNPDAKVYLRNSSDQLPLIWSYELGQGRVVVDNLGIYEKNVRGFYAASYSLLQDVGIYPVINSSAFTLDDFPAPVPNGDAQYITKDYHMSVSDFYTNIWWPNMMSMAKQYGLKYTGVVIENYEDDTTGAVNRQADTSRFTYFGNMILQLGGEIGYHGYNHQPLSFSNVDYGNVFEYNTWKDEQAARAAMDELITFVDTLFPETEKSVYVPPSNVLSPEGRSLLVKYYPNIRVIASSYFGEEFAYEQEFGVAEDGIIEEPRISSGTIMDEYTKLTMVSELNLHYVSHHFVHPDDPLDEERGASLGWEQMFKNLSQQMAWLYKSAPTIRNMTESQMGGAIQRYSSISVEKAISPDKINLNLRNFQDEAYLMVRINEGKLGKVTGGSLEHLTGDLYLLHATKARVEIERQ